MSRKANTPLILAVLLIVISLAVGGVSFYLFQKERIKAKELQERLEEVITKQRITESKLRESEKLISEMQLKLDEAQVQISSLKDDLQRESSIAQESLAKLETIKAELEEQKNVRIDLEQKLTSAEDNLKKTQDQLIDLEKQKIELESKIEELEVKAQKVELGQIVVSPSPEETIPPKKDDKKKSKRLSRKTKEKSQEKTIKKEDAALSSGTQGKVLVVNKEYSFVVINIGSKDGVKVGDIFSVYHNDKYLGDVKVEKLHDSMSAAGFISGENSSLKITEGDRVVSKQDK